MTELFNYDVLAEQVNTKFKLMQTDAPPELELVDVTEPTVTASQTFFSLFFLGKGDFLLPQGTYLMRHEQLGEIMFFLVPVSRETDGIKYEAVINLLNEPQ